MATLLIVALLLTAVAGTAVVFTRDPVAQTIVFGMFGLTLSFLFVALQAPDVALSEVGVGGVALPALILFTLGRLHRARDERPASTTGRE